MIKDFKPRLYQETIFSTAATSNTLVVLPTGLGKTNIFLMIAAHRLSQYPDSKIIMLGPTRPLIEQYKKVFEKYFEVEPEEVVIFTGRIKPEKRAEMFSEARIILSTPQGLENDVISGRINLRNVSLFGFDEAHKAVGDYSYVWLAKKYHEVSKHERIVGMTASPGTDAEKINEVCSNLFIEAIEVKTDDDPDVAPYVQEMDQEWIKIELPDSFKNVLKYLNECYTSKLREVARLGYLNSDKVKNLPKRELLATQGSLQYELARGNKDFDIMKSISLLTEAIKVSHAIELLESQGITGLYNYMDKLYSESASTKVKAVKNLTADINFKSAFSIVNNMKEAGVEHPKLKVIKDIISEELSKKKDMKIIVFNQYRDSISKLTEEINEIPGAKACMFVGQAKKNGSGLSQKEQTKIIEDFKDGVYNVVCMSSVGEEGLDIPQVDLVIFYEPVPSAVRTIQRRGRTGRQEKGRVIILMSKGTRDEAYKWAAHHKEKRMHRVLKDIKKNLGLKNGQRKAAEKNTNTLNNYIKEDEDIKIYVDHREKGGLLLKTLIDMGLRINLQKLDVGDYILSERVAVEFKTVEDFVDSIVDGRLMSQIKELKRHYERPIIIVQGTQSIYSIRNIHPNSIRGILSMIMVSYGIPVLFTENENDTAGIMSVIAKREQEDTKKSFNAHGDKKPMSTKEQQEYIISSIPGVGPGLSKPLLKKFGSVKAIISASSDELKEVELIGDKKARMISDIVLEEWKED